MPDYHLPLPKDGMNSPAQAAKKIRQAAVEYLYIFKKGKQLRRFKGEQDRITIPEDYLFEMKDAVIVHNHPGGTPFSREDLEAIVRFDAKEMILATSEFIYQITRPYRGWPLDFDSEFTQHQLTVSKSLAKNSVDKLISTNEVDYSKRDELLNHYIWLIFCEMNDVHYVRKETI